jgi:hypothetical protein
LEDIMVRHRLTALGLVALSALVCPDAFAQSVLVNTLTADERAAGWTLLFDGRTLSGWRGYMRQDMPEGWQAVDGALTRVARAGDIITTQKFKNFELVFDFNVAKGGNSGIFFRAIEGPEFIYYAAPEYQVLDDAVHRDGRSPLTSTGSNYAVHPAPAGVAKPAGEWNTGKIVVNGNRVEHWLNGQKIIEYDFDSADWRERVAKSKFNEFPEYGKAVDGHIGIQDHGSRVAFRNIKIRVLP